MYKMYLLIWLYNYYIFDVPILKKKRNPERFVVTTFVVERKAPAGARVVVVRAGRRAFAPAHLRSRKATIGDGLHRG